MFALTLTLFLEYISFQTFNVKDINIFFGILFKVMKKRLLYSTASTFCVLLFENVQNNIVVPVGCNLSLFSFNSFFTIVFYLYLKLVLLGLVF